MQKIVTTATCALAVVLGGCGDDRGTGVSATEGGTSVTTATPTTSGTGDTSSGSGGMASGTETGGSGSATGSTGSGGSTEAQTSDSGGSSGASTGDASTSSASSSGGSGSTGAPVKMPCQVEETEVKPVPPSVLLILDKSGSMSMEKWDHDAMPVSPDVTRWYSLHEVVKGVVTSFDAVVHFGVKLYPKIDAGSYVDVGACVVNPGVEVPIAPKNAQKVLTTIPAANFEVLGGTPMESGLKEGYKYLKELDPSLQRFAIMVADGEISDTCKGENFFEALASVEDALSNYGIPTYVVGIDVDPSTSEQLTGLADAGGKPKPGPEPFYQTTNQIELKEAIQGIVDDTLSCEIAVDPEPAEPELFEVWIDGVEIDAVDTCDQSGWRWKTPHSEIELCGDACKLLKKTGKVSALYFCTPG